jgi:hypothetical protein
MTKRGKLLRWVGAVLSLPAAIYAGASTFFYAWLNAAEPERWPAEKAAIWAYSSLALALVFLGVFVFCVVSLVKEVNRSYKVEQNAT